MPDGWTWTRLGSIATSIQYGYNAPALQSGRIRMVRISDIQNGEIAWNSVPFCNIPETEISKYLLESDDILFARTGGTVGKSHLVTKTPQESIYAGYLVRVRFSQQISAKYAILFFESDVYWKQLREGIEATAQPNFNGAKLSSMFIPLPPWAEQKRIVEKIANLLPHLDEYDKTQTALSSHEAAFPYAFRKSVLQAAVQGKLVAQNSADESAQAMLDRILVKTDGNAKKRGKSKATPSRIFRGSDKRTYETRNGKTVCIDDELPFVIPENWAWTRLEAICSFIHRGKSPVYSPIRQYPVVAQKCNQWSGFSLAKAQFIDPDSISRYSEQDLLRDGDLLWNSTGLGTLGRMAIYDSKANPFGFAVADSHVTVIRPLNEVVFPPFLYYFFANPSVQNVIEDLADGTTKQKELATSTVRNYLIPIPPLAEQGRIVTEIERLLPLGMQLRETI